MKKEKKWRSILLAGMSGVAIIGVLCIFVLNKATRTRYEQLDATDQQMIAELSQIYTTFAAQSDRLWSEDYRLDQKPLLLVRVGQDRGMILPMPTP